MQILFGAHETVIKINSVSISIDYIQHFISTHFSSREIQNNTIYIPKSSVDSYHRTFLLKWLYTLYAKKTNNHLPELKEQLIIREHKAIKIILPKKIVHTLKYKVIDAKTVFLQIQPNNHKIALVVKSYLQTKMHLLAAGLYINFEDDEAKTRLQKFMLSKEFINISHKHLYNTKDFQDFFKKEEIQEKQKETTPYILLGLDKNDTIKTIKKRYKALAKQYHPDVVAHNDNENIQIYTKKFQELQEAYENVLQFAKVS